MIIEALMNLVYSLLNLLIGAINIPGLPEDVTESMDTFITYLDYGASFFALVFPINLTPFFVIFLALFAWDNLYPMIMWILRKIPFLGIE